VPTLEVQTPVALPFYYMHAEDCRSYRLVLHPELFAQSLCTCWCSSIRLHQFDNVAEWTYAEMVAVLSAMHVFDAHVVGKYIFHPEWCSV
jgi:hypothetical protein